MAGGKPVAAGSVDDTHRERLVSSDIFKEIDEQVFAVT